MVHRVNGPRTWVLVCTVLAAAALAAPAFAQDGMVKGTVRDEKGQAVEGAKVVIVLSSGRTFETKSDKKGEFIQLGTPSGQYAISAEKDKLAAVAIRASVSAGKLTEVELVVTAAAGRNTKAGREAAAALKKTFEEGLAASDAGKHDEAIAKFQAGLAQDSTCADCYNNIGYSYAQMKQFDKAEEAYKKAAEIRPNDAAAYKGLANVYNAQRKFDLAAQASAKATELAGASGSLVGSGGNADALYDQGIILWNAGKIAEAQKAFADAVAANPNYAEAHYQLGMALVNQGKLPEAASEFENYLKLAPAGPNAAAAKGLVSQLKK